MFELVACNTLKCSQVEIIRIIELSEPSEFYGKCSFNVKYSEISHCNES